MSLALETRITSELGWNWLDARSSSSTRTQGSFHRQISFSSDATPDVDGIWYCENAEIPALSSVTHSLTALVQTVYDTQIPVAFSALAALYIHNRSASLPLVITNNGSSTASNIVSSSFVNVIVPPGGFFTLCNPASDWEINTARNEIRLQNAFTSAISYDILLLGTLAETGTGTGTEAGTETGTETQRDTSGE